jgi:hypothetical protein
MERGKYWTTPSWNEPSHLLPANGPPAGEQIRAWARQPAAKQFDLAMSDW